MTEQFPEPRFVDAGGVRLAVYEVDGDPTRSKPPIVLVHGWPELGFCWLNNIHPFAQAGHRVIAFDLKGFGRSDAPEDPILYDIDHMTSDLAALLDALEIDKAIFCGHDWGGALIWAMGQLRPERVAGLIGICTPIHPRPPAPPLTIIKARLGEGHYFIRFQERDAPEALFESDVERFFRMMFRKPAPREKWADLIPAVYDLPSRFREAKPVPENQRLVGKEITQVYIDAYKRSGFHGGINLYRNIDRNWALMEGRDQMVRAPSLWIGADLDLFLPPETADGMEALIPDLETHVVADCGHWMMWEKPDEMNALVIDWLERRFGERSA